MGSMEEKDGSATNAPQEGSLSKAKAWRERMNEVLRDIWLAPGRPFPTRTELRDSLCAAWGRYEQVHDLLQQDARKRGYTNEQLPESVIRALLRAMPLTQDEQYALCEELSTLADVNQTAMCYLDIVVFLSHRLFGSTTTVRRLLATTAADLQEQRLQDLAHSMSEVRSGKLELAMDERGRHLVFGDLLKRYVGASTPFWREAFFRLFDTAGVDPRTIPESAFCVAKGFRAALHIWLGRYGAIGASHIYPGVEDPEHFVQAYYFRDVSTWDEAEALLRVHIGISNGDIYHRLESPQQHPFEVLVDGVVMRRMHEHYALRERFPDVDVVKELLDIR